MHKELSHLSELGNVSRRSTGVYSLGNDCLEINTDADLRQLLRAKMVAEELKDS